MKNKVLVKLIIPELETNFDIFLPVNESVGMIKKMVLKCVSDLVAITIDPKTPCAFINKYTNEVYNNNDVVINTSIRNGTEIILLF